MLDQLINTIHLKKRNGGSYILLLGAGCSVSSGCPSAKKLTERLIKDNNLPLDPNKSTLQDVEGHLGRTIFNLGIKDYFSSSCPSKGYWFLAELIKKGYFDLILTTNYDSCLEKTLAKVVNYDGFRVCIRGDISDDRIDELIKLPTPRIKIVKLHGDYQSRNMVVKPQDLWDLKPPLKDTLHNKIKERGIIIIGYSMHDSSVLRTLPRDDNENFWYIDINPPDSITESILSGILVKDTHMIHGDRGNFDEFFSLSTRKLGEKDVDNRKKLFEIFNNNRDDVLERCKSEIDPYKLSYHIDEFSLKIRKCGIKNLVFVHDREAPGGSEVLKWIEKRHLGRIKDRNIFKLHIEGRDSQLYKRRVIGLYDKNDNIVNQIDRSDARFLLIDSISFSGNTLEICRDYLIKKFGKNITVGAAVIYSTREQEKKLSERNYCFKKELFFKVEVVDTYQILFPWGWTFATKPIHSDKRQLNTIDEYIPYKYFSFLPRPWGNILSMVENEQISVKTLYLNPREKTSKHKHFVRNEIFFILDEKVILQVWDEHILLRRGSCFRVPAGTEHRLIGLDEPCRVLEISQEYHDQVEDIMRIEDKYGRENKKGDV